MAESYKTKFNCFNNRLLCIFVYSAPSGGSTAAEAPVPCKYGILMEKTSAISIQFLYNQGFRKVGNFSNFVVMEMEMTSPP